MTLWGYSGTAAAVHVGTNYQTTDGPLVLGTYTNQNTIVITPTGLTEIGVINNNQTPTNPTATLQVTSPSGGTVGMILKAAASSTVDLLQGQDSTGAKVFSISGSGTAAGGIAGAMCSGIGQLTITPTGGLAAGNFVASEPHQGASYKKVILYFAGYTVGSSTDTYTYPVAFAHTPLQINMSGITITATVNASSYTPTAATAQTGFVILEGW